MNDDVPHSDDGRHRVQLIVHSEGDRAALTALLEDQYEIVVNETLQPADCYLIGDTMVGRYREALSQRKQEIHPVFCPVLLIHRSGNRGRVRLPVPAEADGPAVIDELVSAPVDRPTIVRRLENLLARRSQSLTLAQQYTDIQVRFQRLFESTNDAIFVVTADGAEILECNPAACELVGETREMIRRRDLRTFLHGTDETVRSFLNAVQTTGEGWSDSLVCNTTAGERRHLEISAAAVSAETHSQIMLSARDITDRKASQQELELKTQAIDGAPIGITIASATADDYPLVYVNDGFQELTGYSRADAYGRNCRFLQGEATQPEPVATMRQAIADEEPVSVELQNYRNDGTLFWNRVTIAPVRNSEGELTHYVGFQEDVTSRKERERELQLFRKAVENASQAVIITDRDGEIQYVNPAFEAQTGYSKDEAVNRSPQLLNSGKQDDPLYTELWETILAGHRWEANIINQRKSGELYQVQQSISPITDDDGEITHFVAIESDVTNRQLREQQLAVLNRVLRHNLRNGMNVIEGNASLLAEAISDPDVEPLISAITKRAEDLSRLGQKAGTIHSLFDDAPAADCAYALDDLIATVESSFSSTYPDAQLSVGPVDAVAVRADSRLELALSELLSNAVVHNDKSVPNVTVSATRADNSRPGDWIEITVSDNGAGIPEDEWSVIETGTETPLRHGTGLGLWLVYWTVSLFGGELTIDTKGEQTRVVLVIPQATD